jgi:hypothetical protein
MRRDVKEYVRSCDSSQRNRPRSQSPIGLLNQLKVPTRRLEQVTLDFVMELPRTSSGHDAILSLWIDCRKLSAFVLRRRMWMLLGLRSCSSIIGIGNMVSRAGIVSDRDGHFVGKFWQELFRLTQVRLAMSSSHHPQADGQTERTNWTMEKVLRHYVNYRQDNWDEVYPTLEHAYNNSVNATTR